MRKILVLLVFFACSEKEKSVIPPPSTVIEDKSQWIPYEGVIKTEYGEGSIELFLDEAEPGLTSPFEIRGELTKDQVFHLVNGEYSTLSGAAGNEVIFQLHGKILTSHSTRAPRKGTVAFKPEIHQMDLFFITEGGNKLVLIDEDFERVSEDDRYTLYRRSKLFTAEGYVTFEDRYTEFFEQNTRENWLVAPLGEYIKTQRIYDSLVTEKSEGMYMKVLAYSVESDSLYDEPRGNYLTHGVGREFLVIKSILEMKKSDAYTNKEKAAGLGYN